MNGQHCNDLSRDRKLGEFWERRFCELATSFGLTITANQIGRNQSAQAFYKDDVGKYNNIILPDVVVWSFSGQHHEIKHKNPTRNGCFGLEEYRFSSLKRFNDITKQDVFYTIHNHDLCGGPDNKENNINHWLTASVSNLDGSWKYERTYPTWCNSKKVDTNIYFWDTSLFVPLSEVICNKVEKSVLQSNPLQVELDKKELEIKNIQSQLDDERRKRLDLLTEINRGIKGVSGGRSIKFHEQPSLF